VHTPQLNSDSREGLYVARQPILNATGQVFGYELLYRGGTDGPVIEEGKDLETARVLSDAVLSVGLETLTGGKRGFMNMGRQHLLGNVASLLPPKAVVLEVIEKADIDTPLIEACKSLRTKGYSIALEDFVLESPAAALLPYANFVKVNALRTKSADHQAIRRFVPTTTSLVAEHVETAEMYEALRGSGFHLFQGFYFCKPTTFKAGALSARRLAYAQLLTALNDENVTVNRIEDLIKHDASLSYKVLRCVNSAAYGIQRQIQSIRQAVVLLGLDQIKKWASVWALAGLNEGSSSELVSVAILRARSCELIAQTLMSREEASEYFLLGMCSLLDIILQKPMEEALNDLPLSDTVHRALLGEENLARFVLDTVIAYERGLWDEATQLAQMAGVAPAQLPAAYADALKWARELTHTAKAA
jgi:EAL and modified HD-GYP domain-containing signal transduction protein